MYTYPDSFIYNSLYPVYVVKLWKYIEYLLYKCKHKVQQISVQTIFEAAAYSQETDFLIRRFMDIIKITRTNQIKCHRSNKKTTATFAMIILKFWTSAQHISFSVPCSGARRDSESCWYLSGRGEHWQSCSRTCSLYIVLQNCGEDRETLTSAYWAAPSAACNSCDMYEALSADLNLSEHKSCR